MSFGSRAYLAREFFFGKYVSRSGGWLTSRTSRSTNAHENLLEQEETFVLFRVISGSFPVLQQHSSFIPVVSHTTIEGQIGS